jgi:ribose 5-phosphate isomerase B
MKKDDVVYISADHNGFALKKKILEKMPFLDLNKEFKKSDDYPVVAFNLCKKIKNKNKGILICGSGIGVCIAANKIKGIRAALCNSVKEAELSRSHEDANVLCLSAWSLTTVEALKIIKKWLSSSFSLEARHVRRIAQIRCIENGNNPCYSGSR